jgi:hypothetical protein
MFYSIAIALVRRLLDEKQIKESRAFECFLAQLPTFKGSYEELARQSLEAATAFEEALN